MNIRKLEDLSKDELIELIKQEHEDYDQLVQELQAYADAKVREALEEVEKVVVTLYESDDLPYLPDITRAIRALIPKENKS